MQTAPTATWPKYRYSTWRIWHKIKSEWDMFLIFSLKMKVENRLSQLWQNIILYRAGVYLDFLTRGYGRSVRGRATDQTDFANVPL